MFILVLHIGNDVKLLIEQLNFCKLGKIMLSGMNLNPYSVLIPPGGVLVKCRCIHCAAALGVAPTVAGLCGNDAASKNDEIFDRPRPDRPARSPTRRRRANRAN